MSDVNLSKKSKLTVVPRPTNKVKTITPPAKANQSTGPITPEGKCTASSNSTKHGCTSSIPIVRGQLTPEALARIVLPDENRADWEALQKIWQDEYEPETDLTLDLVTRAAVADWMMRRNSRRYNDVEQLLHLEQPDATLWSAAQHAKLELFLRYQAKAERAFYRARSAVEQLRRERKRDAEKAPEPPPLKATVKVADPDNPEKEVEQLLPKPTGSLIQCITVQVLDGKTFTLFQPRSENLTRIIISADDPKPTVKRALYFLHGIPAEYEWIKDYENHDGRPHFVITRTSEQALQDLERERQDGTGHLLRVK